MNPAPSLDTLLEKLGHGESEAAERVFRDYEPFLRAMVRRKLNPMLRAKFDSMDVVQSVWADVLRGYREGGWQFHDREHLRAFLARVTYNHFATHCRRHRAALEREQPWHEDEVPTEPTSGQPRPSQIAQADELWTMLMDLCPPAHRPILELKGQGVPLAEIAQRTGLHESSVRRILYDLAKKLATARARSAAH
jgi:RNA polymerase sigma-70 factor (ECF subfamily)